MEKKLFLRAPMREIVDTATNYHFESLQVTPVELLLKNLTFQQAGQEQEWRRERVSVYNE